MSTHRALFEPEVDADAPTPEKIKEFVAARVRLHEAVAPGARAARLSAHRSTVVARQLHDTRIFLRRQVERIFERELAGDRAALLPAVDELCSFEAYEFMRAGHRMTRPKATAALAAALRKLLDDERGTS